MLSILSQVWKIAIVDWEKSFPFYNKTVKPLKK